MLRIAATSLASAAILAACIGTLAAAPISIMPLGDSITDGVGVPGGYRAPLFSDLQAAGLNPQFVGSQSDNPAPGMTSPDHEGLIGYTISEIDYSPEGVTIASRITTYQPDITLLHIGTNDITEGHTLSQEMTNLNTLITSIESVRLTDGLQTKLFVAEIIPTNDGLNAQTVAYNAEVARLVAVFQAHGQPVYLVNMYSALNPNTDLSSDNVHPNAAGYAKMAGVWASAIESLLLVPEPSCLWLSTVGLVGLALAVRRHRKS